ncbi:MAG: glycosyltransferase family 4 protein [Caldiserica bacterium]|nr:glycosyltransferase family 4 protein [Caldisericota bacterium]
MNRLDKKVVLLITAPADPHRAEKAYRKELKDLIKKLHLEDKVILLNEFPLPKGESFPLNFENLKALYAISDFLLLPSIIEGFGLPILEAGISRLPVFCSDIPTLKEVGQDNLHYFSLQDTPATIAERILKTLTATPLSRLFRRVKNDFSWEKILDEHLLPLLQ